MLVLFHGVYHHLKLKHSYFYIKELKNIHIYENTLNSVAVAMVTNQSISLVKTEISHKIYLNGYVNLNVCMLYFTTVHITMEQP